MSVFVDALLYGWNKNADYAARLVADLSPQQMTHIVPDTLEPANHPAWILSHLNAYIPIVVALVSDRNFDDPREHKYGMLSRPEPSLDAYPAKDELVREFVDGHRQVDSLLRAAPADLIDRDVTLPRWQPTMPKVGIVLSYLMLAHESLHLGQLSAWRRLQKLPHV